MNIEDIMSKDLIVGYINDTIYALANKMQKWDIGFIPIADNTKIVGVITDRDIVVSAISNNIDLNTEVGKYMTRNIISIEKKQSIEEALNLMGKQKIKRLLVTDNGKFVGILSLSDIINIDLDSKLIINNLKKIWEISRNVDEYKTEIDAFYL